MKYVQNYTTVTVGVVAILSGALVSGCEQRSEQAQQTPQAKGAFVIIEETSAGRYKIKEEFPSDETRIVLKKLDGSEKLLTREEMDALLEEEMAKIESGTSVLVADDSQARIEQQGGLSLGEAILASAAGAIIGSWIGSKLFNNPNYQNAKRASYRTPSAYNRSQSSFSKPRKSTSAKKSGFFGSKGTSMRKSGGFFGG